MSFMDKALSFVGIRDAEFEERLRDENPVALAFIKGIKVGAAIGAIVVLFSLKNSGVF